MINVVQIGLKGHQGTCLSEIAAREDVRLAGAWEESAAAVEKLKGAKYCDEKTVLTPNLDELLALKDIDVAILAEDNGSRAENLIACAHRGWHIVAEKPLTTSLADLDRVEAAVKEAGIRLSMLLTMRFEPPYLAIKGQIAAGAIGRPLQLAAQKSYKRGTRPAWQQNRASFGGTIPFIGIHMLDLLQFVTGCRYSRVAATQHNEGLPGAGTIEETAAILLETADGQIAQVRLDYLRPGKAPTHGDDRLRVAGSDGVIETIGGQVTLLTADQEPQQVPLGQGGSLFGSFLDELAGQGTHPISAAECFAITRVSLKARQAAEAGVWVTI